MCVDLEGSVPLWEALLGAHESVIRTLSDNGAKITSGDVGLFSCTAAEANNLELLKEIVRHGGDVTKPKINGPTALHVAVCEGNIEIVKFLLDRGANIHQPDEHGWTPKDLAEQQGHDDIKEIFEQYKQNQPQPSVAIPEQRHGVRFLGRFKSEPSITPGSHDMFPPPDGSWGRARPRRRTNNFYNSLFGIISAARTGENDLLSSVNKDKSGVVTTTYAARVTISCPETQDFAGRLVLLPNTFQELLEIGVKKYGFLPSKVLTKDGAVIDDLVLIRDGDHLVFSSDNRNKETR